MENTKFNLVSIVLLVVLIGLGVLAVITLTPPKRYSANSTVATTTDTSVPDVDDVVVPNTDVDTGSQPTAPTGTPTTSTGATNTPAATDHTELINNLQKLLDAKTVLKAGDKGTNVSYIQTFLNLYNKTNDKVDSDFGPSLTSAVKSFQSKNAITPQSGQVAEKTLTKMIEWLKAQ